jgi:hypothetical protein
VTIEANRMCSHRSAQPNGSTIGGNPAQWSQWLHLVGDRNCLADNFHTPGRVCADVGCQPPVRPRGGLQCDEAEPASAALKPAPPTVVTTSDPGRLGDRTVQCRWWAIDTQLGSVRVLRDFSLTAMPRPAALPDSVRGLRQNGTALLVPQRSLGEGGEMVALHAKGYGVLDVTLVF